METLLTFFGLPVTSFGAGAAGALAACLIGAGAYAGYKGVRYRCVVRMAVLAVPLALLFARLFYVLANCTYYLTTLSNPALALRFWDGGYALSGALFGVVLAARLTEKWQRLPRGLLMDAAGLGAPLGILIERLCEQGTGLGLGRTIYADWLAAIPFCGVTDETGEIVHAVWRYEAVAAGLILLGVLVWLVARGGNSGERGDLLLIVLTLLGAAQVLWESLRNDGHMVVHFVRINQVLAALLPLSALFVWSRRLARDRGSWKGLPLASWITDILAIALATVQEFRVDASENPFLDYGLMALCLVVYALMPLLCRSRAEASGNPLE